MRVTGELRKKTKTLKAFSERAVKQRVRVTGDSAESLLPVNLNDTEVLDGSQSPLAESECNRDPESYSDYHWVCLPALGGVPVVLS